MVSAEVENLVRLAEQLSAEEQEELLNRLMLLRPSVVPRFGRRPSDVLEVFHVDEFPAHLTLRREDEYGDDER